MREHRLIPLYLMTPSAYAIIRHYLVHHSLPHVKKSIPTAEPISTTVIQPITLDIRPLVLSFRNLLSLAIFITETRIGTATIPLITALYTNALIGSKFVKFISRPTIVEAAITR